MEPIAEGCRYGNRGEESTLTGLMESAREAGREIQPLITDWERLVSPFADQYDAGRIVETGRRVLETIHDQMRRFATATLNAEAGFRATVGMALAGLSEQVTNRLGSLAAGQTVEQATLSQQVNDAVARIHKDPMEERLADEASLAAEIRDDLRPGQLSEEALVGAWVTYARRGEELRSPDLRPADEARIRAEQSRLERFLAGFERAIDVVEKKPRQEREIKDRRQELDGIDRSLTRKGLKQEEREDLLRRREAMARELVRLEMPYLETAAETLRREAKETADHLEEYRDGIVEARAAIGKDLVDFWKYARDRLLKNIPPKTAELLRELDSVGRSVERWQQALLKGILDGKELLRIATELAEEIDTYSKRVDLVLRDLAARPENRQMQDEFASHLTALRSTLADRLKALLQSEAFR